MQQKAVHSFIKKTSSNTGASGSSREKSSWRNALGTISGATEPLAKVWVDELQSHFECDFELE